MIVDYETYPLSRNELRFFAKVIRKKLNIKQDKIPIIKLLDILEINYKVLISIDSDDECEKNVYASLTIEQGIFVIHIRNSVYERACEGNKTCIGFICHEMCHYFLISWFGYSPIFKRTPSNQIIDRYRSMEWQAKALCGELMIPYENYLLSDVYEIMKNTDSSYCQARYYIDVVRDNIDALRESFGNVENLKNQKQIKKD